MVKAKILDVDVEKERISLGVKQLGEDKVGTGIEGMKKGQVVTCTVKSIQEAGIEVTVAEGIPGYIRKADLARDRQDQRTDRFAVGEKVDAKITTVDKAARKLNLSIKAFEVEEEKQAMADFGSTDSGAALGEILGAALKAKQQEKATKE